MRLAIIAAIAKNRVIGRDGKIPWHISEDLKRFKRLTTGHTVMMGRRTWESLRRPLPGRRNVVITSGDIPGVEHYDSPEKALSVLQDQDKVFVMGGAELYSDLLDKADELYLTFVDLEVEGDTYFPEYDEVLRGEFTAVNREMHPGFEFVDYIKTGTKKDAPL